MPIATDCQYIWPPNSRKHVDHEDRMDWQWQTTGHTYLSLPRTDEGEGKMNSTRFGEASEER
ncbi:hypothetical protein GB937_008029 [Aspergillus fischeri]|nr:hypothetical protein GB937_008029 [Aspergillus fischeri]